MLVNIGDRRTYITMMNIKGFDMSSTNIDIIRKCHSRQALSNLLLRLKNNRIDIIVINQFFIFPDINSI
jgi:hypothetical protein